MKRMEFVILLVVCFSIANFLMTSCFAASDNADMIATRENDSYSTNIFEPFSSVESIVQNAQLCSSGTPQELFFDGFEAGVGNWQSKLEVGTQDPWTISNEFPYAGSNSLLGSDLPATSLTCKEIITAVEIPANSFMNFQHAHDFEYYSDDPSYFEYFDGGFVEFSTDGGTTWNDCGSLFTANGYNATGDNTISSSSGNPIGGRNAFGGFSVYKSSTVNLSSLSGKSVLFRFCIGTDSSNDIANDIGDPIGWFIDNVFIYRCITSTTTIKPTTSIMPPTTSSVLPTTTILPVTTIPGSTTTIVVPPPTTTSSMATSSIPVTTSVQPTTTTSIGKQCPFVAVADGEPGKLSLLRQYRDKILRKTPTGRAYIKLFYEHSLELTRIVLNNPSVAAEARRVMNSFMPNLKAAVQGKTMTINQAELSNVISVLNEINVFASPSLSRFIQKTIHDLRQNKVLGVMGIKVIRQ